MSVTTKSTLERKGRVHQLTALKKAGRDIMVEDQSMLKAARILKLIETEYHVIPEAVNAICESPETIPHLLDALINCTNENGSLGRNSSTLGVAMREPGMKERMMPLLIKALGDEDVKFARGAANVLAHAAYKYPKREDCPCAKERVDITEAFPALQEAADKKNMGLKDGVFRAFHYAADGGADISAYCATLLKGYIETDNSEYGQTARNEAQWAFRAAVENKRSKDAVMAFLYEKLSSKNDDEILAALDMFGDVGLGRKTIVLDPEAFERLAQSGSEEVRADITLKNILTELRGTAAQEKEDYAALETMLCDPETSRDASKRLGELLQEGGDKARIVKILITAMGSGNEVVRYEGLMALNEQKYSGEWFSQELLEAIGRRIADQSAFGIGEHAIRILFKLATNNTELCYPVPKEVWDIVNNRNAREEMRETAVYILRKAYEGKRPEIQTKD